MLIAVTTENGNVFQHFGHCKNFTLFETEGEKIKNKTMIDVGEEGHSALATLLGNHNVDVLICGGIGGGARVALAQNGVEVIPGTAGSVDEVTAAYLKGDLKFDADFVCTAHGHGHGHDHGGEHSCGQHRCNS